MRYLLNIIYFRYVTTTDSQSLARMIARKMKTQYLLVLIFFSLSTPAFSGDEFVVADWQRNGIGGWLYHDFSGKTIFGIDNEANALRAEARDSGSSFYRNIEIDINKTPYINWSWRADYFDGEGYEREKDGDDFVVRLYAVAKSGFFPWQKRALVYVVSRQKHETSFWPSPFTDNIVMVAVDNYEEVKGEWRSYKVNLKEDFKLYLDADVDSLEAVALMSDTDNSGGSAIAYYGNIYLSDE